MSMQEIWHVKLPSGDVRPLSLDELDAAYEAGRIDLSTPVLPPAAISWSTLGNVAGLDPEPMPLSIAPVAYGRDLDVDLSASDLDDVPAELRPRRTGRKVFGFLVAVAVVAGLGFAATKARPGMAASASAFVKSHLPGARSPRPAADSAPAKVAAAAPAPPAPAPPPPAVTAAPAPSPTVAASAVATVSAADLKPAKKGKRR